MRKVTQAEFDTAYADHQLWLAGNGGKQMNFSGCDLSWFDAKGANLSYADLADAILTSADLGGADLVDVDLTRADLEGATFPYEIPIVENLHKKMLGAVEAGDLDMGDWHSKTCKTTHCRAGHAINFAGEAGYALEKLIRPGTAGALIYWASTKMVPDFYCSNAEAIQDIRRCAGLGD